MILSYIIPLYNAEPFIGECLDSVLNCDVDKSQFEVIVVDDGSTDNGLSVAQEYANKYSNIRVFHQENQGQSVARNYGIKEAKGDYLWFVDSDDYVDATNVSSILEMMVEKDIEICRFEMKVFKEDGTSYLTNNSVVEYNNVYSGKQVLLNGVAMGSICSGFFSRDFIIDNNLAFYPGIFNEDSEFSIIATSLVDKIIYLKQHIYIYRYNENSSTRSGNFDKKLKSHISDAIIAFNIHEFIRRSGDISEDLKEYMDDYASSIIKGNLVSFLTHKDNDSLMLFKAFLEKASELGEYPIKIRRHRLKDVIVSCVVNNRIVMESLVKIKNMFRF